MKEIDTLQKLKLLSGHTQILLLTRKGQLLKSCDTLFPTSFLQNKAVQEWMPFMESIFASIASLQRNMAEIRFTKIETPAPFLPGYYDFVFSIVQYENSEYIMWSIFDYTKRYLRLIEEQQQHNEAEIYRQLFHKPSQF